MFTKPADALAGPDTSIRIHPDVQGMLDYEAELTVVFKRDIFSNLPGIDDFCLFDYILAYMAGNDVSARDFQQPGVSGGQFCYAKSSDGFVPIGPCIVNPEVITDPKKVRFSKHGGVFEIEIGDAAKLVNSMDFEKDGGCEQWVTHSSVAHSRRGSLAEWILAARGVDKHAALRAAQIGLVPGVSARPLLYSCIRPPSSLSTSHRALSHRISISREDTRHGRY